MLPDALDEVKVTKAPLQIEVEPDELMVGGAGAPGSDKDGVILLLEQPLPSVKLTVYDPAPKPVMV